MDTLRTLYDWSERTFWNSLSKKLMSFLLLFFVDVAYLGIYFHYKQNVVEELRKAGVNAELTQRIGGMLDQGLTLMVVITVAALCWNVLQILYLRYLIVRPVKAITNI